MNKSNGSLSNIVINETSVISQDSPAFIVAEAACNHLCDMDLAKKMVDKAVEAGANSIKFQT